MNIPMNGNVCPYCKADKAPDQIVQGLGVGGGALGAGVGFVAGSLNVGIIAVLAGVFIGTIIGLIAAENYKKKNKK